MRCKWHFRDNVNADVDEIPAFRTKSTWKPPNGCAALELFLSQVEKELFNCGSRVLRKHNLTKNEWQTLRALQEDNSIIVKPADKGSCVVVWDREDYLTESYTQLRNNNVYTRKEGFSEETIKILVGKSNDMFQKLYEEHSISRDELGYFSYDLKNACTLGRLYLLPKIHKRSHNVPGRPVISNCGTPTEKVSEFLDHHLKPIMKSGKSYIRDTGHFLEKLREIQEVPENALLVTADVTSLYPSIPHEDGLRSLFIRLEARQDKRISSESLIEMADFVLKNNYFEFNSEVYCQSSGTAMGTKFAPSYACIFMDMVETKFLEQQAVKPWMWLRYIDDIFFVWLEGEQKLMQFMNELNEFHSNLKFTYEYSNSRANFLDVEVGIECSQFVTRLFSKPTDCHQYLHYESSHPLHVKKSIVLSQGLRIRKVCSRDEEFQRQLEDLEGWFESRGYPTQIVKGELKKVNARSRETLFRLSKDVKKKGVPLTITFHPLLSGTSAIINKYLPILYLDLGAREVFSPRPFVSFKTGRSVKNLLVRAKIQPLVRETGCRKCRKARCLTCRNMRDTDTFACRVDGKQYTVNHRLDCDTKCVVYLLTCKTCGLQYVGQTTDKFRLRWNNYKACQKKAIRNESHTQVFFHQHFLEANHNGLVNDCEITLIDKTDPAEPTIREAYWIERLKTIYPLGLNIQLENA